VGGELAKVVGLGEQVGFEEGFEGVQG